MKKFTDIEQFRHVVKRIRWYYEKIGQLDKLPTLAFVGTVKLHGTNAGVRRTADGEFVCQSREQIITVDNDNHGFAKFISDTPDEVLHDMFDTISPYHSNGTMNSNITLFGEWIGKGIQGGVGVSQLNKQWVIFNAYIDGEYASEVYTSNKEYNIYNIHDGPHYSINIDFNDPAKSLPKLEALTLEVEKQCPWAKLFGVEGIGEGIVWKCLYRMADSDLFFKIKGSKHSGKKKSPKEMVNIDPQKVEDIGKCIDIILTEERLNQGFDKLKEKGIELEMKALGPYLKWVGQDVKKEEMDTIEANNLVWKDVGKIITLRAKKFFVDKLDEF